LFKNAFVRRPAINFADGLTSVHLGIPDYEKVLHQHAEYCKVLESSGVQLTVLEEDPRYPDSTFVEDAAVLVGKSAILTRPGAKTREGEVTEMHKHLKRFFPRIHEIRSPGTIDGGDVCEVEGHFFIGISRRTNEEGARQMAGFLGMEGHTASLCNIRQMNEMLHLKSGVTYIGENNLVLRSELRYFEPFQKFNRIEVSGEESYAANCLYINDRVLIPAGFPKLKKLLERLGYRVMLLEMSEFQKMDGGPSCLSLRF